MNRSDRRTRVLFLQSQEYFGADSLIHHLIAQNLDRSRFKVYVACQSGSAEQPSDAFQRFSSLQDVCVRPTHFGPSIHYAPRRVQLARLATSLPYGLRDITALTRFIRREGIEILHGTEKPRDVLSGLLLTRL